VLRWVGLFVPSNDFKSCPVIARDCGSDSRFWKNNRNSSRFSSVGYFLAQRESEFAVFVVECDWYCGSRRVDFATSCHVGSDFSGGSCNDRSDGLLCIHLHPVRHGPDRGNHVDLLARHNWEIRVLAVVHSLGRAAPDLFRQQ
jgi:hypothetical protein